MSGVYIKGLNIEPYYDGHNGKGLVIVGYGDILYAVKQENIIPVPDHGRLVDADALKVHHGIDVGANHGGLRAVVFKKDIDNAKTIIEADRSDG